MYHMNIVLLPTLQSPLPFVCILNFQPFNVGDQICRDFILVFVCTNSEAKNCSSQNCFIFPMSDVACSMCVVELNKLQLKRDNTKHFEFTIMPYNLPFSLYLSIFKIQISDLRKQLSIMMYVRHAH